MTKRSSNRNGKAAHSRSMLHKLGSSLAPGKRIKRIRIKSRPAVLITGGAGFIGTNVAHYFLSRGQPVRVFDNLSRSGVEKNLAWLQATHGTLLQVEVADIQDYGRLRNAVRDTSQVFHLAAQVAVTTSLDHPFHDFEVNARGTLNLLEALRQLSQPPPLVFTSTNKVYGDLSDVALQANGGRYEPEHKATRTSGFNESRLLHFHSPYGCSKGAAEQYVLDYARTFGLPTVVFRMSCIYGPHQCGTEDQGWVAHFFLRGLHGSPITIFGDGKQVRDILYVDDLVSAFVLAQRCMPSIAGQVFNIGGGPSRTVSLLELLELMEQVQESRPVVRFDDWRPADQRYYVSDIRKFSAATGWTPRTTVAQGIRRLSQWLSETDKPSPRADTSGTTKCDSLTPAAETETAEEKVVIAAPAIATEPRSKRIWKLGTAESLSGKIIKFP